MSQLAATNRPHVTPTGATNRCASPGRQRPYQTPAGLNTDQLPAVSTISQARWPDPDERGDGSEHPSTPCSENRKPSLSQSARPAPARPERRHIAPDKPRQDHQRPRRNRQHQPPRQPAAIKTNTANGANNTDPKIWAQSDAEGATTSPEGPSGYVKTNYLQLEPRQERGGHRNTASHQTRPQKVPPPPAASTPNPNNHGRSAARLSQLVRVHAQPAKRSGLANDHGNSANPRTRRKGPKTLRQHPRGPEPPARDESQHPSHRPKRPPTPG